MRRITATLAAAAALGLAGCSSDHSSADSKYTQTWTTPYSETTCTDYLHAMSGKQRWAMAADMLTSERTVDGNTAVPADSQVTRFQADMAAGCEGQATAAVGDIAVSIYKLDASYQP